MSLEYKTVESVLDLICGNWYSTTQTRDNWRRQINKACAKVPGMILFSMTELFIQSTSSQYMPPFGQFVEFIKDQCGQQYFRREHGEYCDHCQHFEGWREILATFRDSEGEYRDRLFKARCDCSSEGLSGNPWTWHVQKIEETHAAMRRPGDPDCSILVSDSELTNLRNFSGETWRMRLDRGYFGEDEHGAVYPIWSHDFWLTSVAPALLEDLNREGYEWIMPDQLIERRKRKRVSLLRRMNKHKSKDQLLELIGDYT